MNQLLLRVSISGLDRLERNLLLIDPADEEQGLLIDGMKQTICSLRHAVNKLIELLGQQND